MRNACKRLYQGMHAVSNLLCKLTGFISFCFVVLCTLTVLLQIVNRYVIVKVSNYSATFTDELARFLFIWISYTAVSMCLREGSMAQVDILYTRLGKRGRLLLYLFTRIVMGAVLFIIIRYGFWFAGKKKAYHSTMLNIPGNILYATVPIGGVLLAFECLTELVGVLAGEVEPFKAKEKRWFPEHEDLSNSDEEKLAAYAEQLESELGGTGDKMRKEADYR